MEWKVGILMLNAALLKSYQTDSNDHILLLSIFVHPLS